jgi:hypothetical protein
MTSPEPRCARCGLRTKDSTQGARSWPFGYTHYDLTGHLFVPPKEERTDPRTGGLGKAP